MKDRDCCLEKNQLSSGYSCAVCDRSFNKSLLLVHHLRHFHADNAAKSRPLKHGRKRRHKCTTCNRQFSDTVNLRRHSFVHRPFACEQCDYRGTCRTQLRDHVLEQHLRSERSFTCPICGRALGDRHSLTRHARVHLAYVDRPFACRQCHYRALRKADLRSHVTRWHSEGSHRTQDSERSFVCPTCERALKDRHTLGAHARVHLPYAKKPFACVHCDYRALRKAGLRGHLLYVHSGGRVVPRRHAVGKHQRWSRPMTQREMALHKDDVEEPRQKRFTTPSLPSWFIEQHELWVAELQVELVDSPPADVVADAEVTHACEAHALGPFIYRGYAHDDINLVYDSSCSLMRRNDIRLCHWRVKSRNTSGHRHRRRWREIELKLLFR